ncbi:MAG: YciI family protein [Desulfomonilia bacterium]
MQFLIIAYDGTDEHAQQRRLAHREQHLSQIETLKEEGKALFGAAQLNEQSEMIGSVLVMEFGTQEELKEYLEKEPYVTGGVWEKIDVKPCAIAPLFLNT